MTEKNAAVKANTLFTGDNLYILHGMNSESIDLIYLDPPFNSKRMYEAPVGSKAAGASFKDMWTWKDVDKFHLEKLFNNYPFMANFIATVVGIHGEVMMSYLTYMCQRIIEMHRVLKDTGSLYLHCDPTASHYLKIILDRIFGKDNIVGMITWKRHSSIQKGSQYYAKTWGVTTDNIFHYKKGKNQAVFRNTRKLLPEEISEKFSLMDEKGERYRLDNHHIFRTPNMGDRPNLCYTWKGFKNPHSSGWRLSKERLQEEYEKGNIVIKENGKLERRKYLKDYEGVPVGNLWDGIFLTKREATGYPTQKPLKLLYRIIEASSNKGDVVFDPFCGCATAMVAAQQLGRKWIGIDIAEKSLDLVVGRLEDDSGLFTDFVHRKDLPKRNDIKEVEFTPDTKERLFKKQEGKCNGCYVVFEKRNLEQDHIVPKSKGGGDYFENYQLLCGNCNRVKGDRPMEFLRVKIEKMNEVKRLQVSF